jgi:hypothetical protein
MSDAGSPDAPLGTETFEQGDEALDEASRLNPDFIEELELDPSLSPSLQLDERELEEAGVTLDDPELLATLDGGIDDPDGIDPDAISAKHRARHGVEDEEGWDLSAPLARHDDDEELPG